MSACEETAWDVVVATTEVFAGLSYDRIPSPRSFCLPFDLGGGIAVEKLPDPLAQKIMDACEPVGLNFRPCRQYDQLYSLVRRSPLNTGIGSWDLDGELQRCIAFSRLVKPTSKGFEYSARVVFAADGGVDRVIPGAVSGFGAQAFVGDTSVDDWLTQEDLEALAKLWSVVDFASAPARLQRAFWLHEYVARTGDMAIRWVLASAGIESLINTSADRASKQFVVRLVGLAKRFSGKDVSRTEANRIYKRRLQIAHGTTLAGAGPDDLALYLRLESTLRDTLRGALTDNEAKSLFASDASINQEWPLE